MGTRVSGDRPPDGTGTRRRSRAPAGTAPLDAAPGPDGAAPGREASRVKEVLEIVGAVVAPTTLVTGLALYFGVVRTNTQAAFFGIDGSLFGFSAQEYLLRSPDALFVPLGATFVAGLLGVRAHAFVDSLLARRWEPKLMRQGTLVAAAMGAALFAVGAGATFWSWPASVHVLFPPLALCTGITVFAYAGWVRRRTADDRASAQEPGWVPATTVVLVALVVVIGMFWATSEYARALGRGRAEAVVAALPRRSEVVLHSRQALGLSGPGVVETVAGADAAYPYRYTGLQLLVRTGGKYFLIPTEWDREKGVVMVVPDDDQTRLDVGVAQS
jgi:hypothetical protein